MQFTSLTFLVFFAVVVLGHYALRHRHRWVWLLGASYVFYMWWRPEFATLIAFSTLVDYSIGRAVPGRSDRQRRLLLSLSLLVNLGMLVAFKYADFLQQAFADVVAVFGVTYEAEELGWVLPVGISFYTFQTLSYTIDVCRGRIPVERHFGRFALYVAFFPQLVAGPIERASRLLPQLAKRVEFDYDRSVSGLRLMLWGFMKKTVVADRLALMVDPVYGSPWDHGPHGHAVATIAFAFQIYCDFSGYSDIAIGAARVLGYDLMLNFRQPYLSQSIAEFWRRWHISLSTWFRDYLYFPLGGSRASWWVVSRNVMIVFVVSGVWHGANWTYVTWGAIHGGVMVASSLWRRLVPDRASPSSRPLAALGRVLRTVRTFVIVCVAWTYFRAESVADANAIVLGYSKLVLPSSWTDVQLSYDVTDLQVAGLLVAGLLAIETWQQSHDAEAWLARLPTAARWTLYLLGGSIVLFWGVTGDRPFIYFQF